MEILILTHAPFEGPGFFGEVLSDHGSTVRTVAMHEDPGALPDGTGADVILAMGGPLRATDDAAHPWLLREAEFLGRAAREGRKVLGICLGAQILARGLGASVRPGTPEIGYGPVDLADEGKEDPVLAGLRSPETVLHWHGDIFDLPANAVGLASTPATPNQGFRLGRHAYGLQFHLEVGREQMERWLAEPAMREQLAATLGAPSPDQLLAQAAAHEKRLSWLCSSVMNRLFNLL